MNYQTQIMSIAENRGVEFLLHFTQIKNLHGIAARGILPQRELGLEHAAYASDQYRLDENDNAVSVSISRVNERMFDAKRHKNEHSKWVVLVLSPEILWTHSCQFCWCNAATTRMKNHRGRRNGPWAFAEMFAGSNEARSGIPDCFPTDLEAEVQVLERISPEHILAAVVAQNELVEPVRIALTTALDRPLPVVVSASYSLYESDSRSGT